MAEPVRVVAVFGYSGLRGDGLHPICARRLEHAECVSAGARAVILSGWCRRRRRRGEAELMQAGWSGPPVPLVCDTTARSTVENAASTARIVRDLAADEVLLVTSWWHRPRARLLLRAALQPGITVRTSSPRGGTPLTVLVREAACLLALPVQILRCRRVAARPRFVSRSTVT